MDLLVLLTSHPLLHTPQFLLLRAFRNPLLRMTSAALQFGHKFLYSHPSLSFCSSSEVHNPFQSIISLDLDTVLNLKVLFLHMPRYVSIIIPDFPLAMFYSSPLTLYGLPICLYFEKKKIDFILGHSLFSKQIL